MQITDLEYRSSVLQAIDEFDEKGRARFLSDHHFGKARSYFLLHNRKLYDSKAIAGVAFEKEFGEIVGPEDFNGGERTVCRALENLGFIVLNIANASEHIATSALDQGKVFTKDELKRLFSIDDAIENEEPFNPSDIEDARVKAMRAIAIRAGQPKFRQNLLNAYGRCVITGCEVAEVLEAAHIFPYRGEETNHITNGLLLRSDIHNLFDLGLISINADTYTVLVSDQLKESEYFEFAGKKIFRPEQKADFPSAAALKAHMDLWGFKL